MLMSQDIAGIEKVGKDMNNYKLKLPICDRRHMPEEVPSIVEALTSVCVAKVFKLTHFKVDLLQRAKTPLFEVCLVRQIQNSGMSA